MSRDMSADTTLDNANMGTREDFEKQARLLDSARREGWAHRQPEIDALKAENERLRKDAERYQWLRDPKTDIALVIDKVVDEIPSEEGTGYDGLKVYEYRAGEELDAAIDAAMKDFSTQPKEE